MTNSAVAEIYIERSFSNLNYVLLLKLRPAHYPNAFSSSEYLDKICKQICVSLAYKFSGIGVLHTHQKRSLGGNYAPHIHLFLDIPIDQIDAYESKIENLKKRKDKNNIFHIVPNKDGIRLINNWQTHLRYLLGEARTHLPKEVFFKKSMPLLA
jgi:hypothetical protein